MAMFVSGSSTSTGSFGSVHMAGRVGIGTAAPGYMLHVEESVDGNYIVKRVISYGNVCFRLINFNWFVW